MRASILRNIVLASAACPIVFAIPLTGNAHREGTDLARYHSSPSLAPLEFHADALDIVDNSKLVPRSSLQFLNAREQLDEGELHGGDVVHLRKRAPGGEQSQPSRRPARIQVPPRQDPRQAPSLSPGSWSSRSSSGPVTPQGHVFNPDINTYPYRDPPSGTPPPPPVLPPTAWQLDADRNPRRRPSPSRHQTGGGGRRVDRQAAFETRGRDPRPPPGWQGPNGVPNVPGGGVPPPTNAVPGGRFVAGAPPFGNPQQAAPNPAQQAGGRRPPMPGNPTQPGGGTRNMGGYTRQPPPPGTRPPRQ
ncbi:hypothetical protein K474DRAFT_1359856 [Panus rudis PR-1116 ss-1]|nr:hypothetical protein K474DRAFT_1359856 [Panus rudis PR-1116 ss-1]